MKDYKNAVLKELKESMECVKEEEIVWLAQEIASARQVFCDGLGRSGLVMKAFAMRLGQMGIRSVSVGEVTASAFGPGDLLVIGSASGSSAVLKYHAQKAKELGGRVALVTSKESSPLTEFAAGSVLVKAQDKDAMGTSIQPMGALFEQSAQLVCDMTVLELMDQLQLTSEEMRKHHANIE